MKRSIALYPFATTLPRRVFAFALLSLCLAGGAAAQAASDAEAHDRDAAYDRAIAEALRAYEDLDYDAALRAFTTAHALSPNARTHRGLGVTLYALGDYPQAVEHLDAALASAVVPLDADLRAQTQQLRDAAAQQVNPASLAASTDDPVSTEARDAPEGLTDGEGARADEASPGTETVASLADNASAPPADAGDTRPNLRRTRVAWALAGTAYAAVALSGLPLALGRSRLDSLSDWCTSQPGGGCTAEQRDAEWESRRIETLRRTSRGLAIAGTVTALAFTVFALHGRRDRQLAVGVSLLEPGARLRMRF